ncbi:MAG: hypothetical protein JOZ51_12900 [Chloroflexi bacterium]|nr:hypothetical protein [Chloroflexota bacterium]
MAKEYFPLSFNSEGFPINLGEQRELLAAIVDDAHPVTDLWILAHGWNNDINQGQATYLGWIQRMREVARQKVHDPSYHSLFAGVHWPSKAWAGDVAQMVAAGGAAIPTGGGEGEFELRRPGTPADELPAVQVPESALAPSPKVAVDPVQRTAFIAQYQPIMDPEGVYGLDYVRDFGRLYDLMFQAGPPPQHEVEEFLRLLKKYKTTDPHNDNIETVNVLSAPISELAQRLTAELSAAPQEYERLGIFDRLLDVFRTFTFWQMKGRAAIVGETGIYPFLVGLRQELKKRNHSVRIHLMGHSFGAKLVSAAVFPAAGASDLEHPLVDTLVLLLGAFSQFSFSNNIPVARGAVGRYSAILQQKLVKNPIVTIYSQHDTANRVFYAAGMRLASPFSEAIYELAGAAETAEAYKISRDRYGSIGANGAQGLVDQSFRAIDIQPLNKNYNWGNLAGVTCINIDGASVINNGTFPTGAHSDIEHPEIFHLALSISLR